MGDCGFESDCDRWLGFVYIREGDAETLSETEIQIKTERETTNRYKARKRQCDRQRHGNRDKARHAETDSETKRDRLRQRGNRNTT